MGQPGEQCECAACKERAAKSRVRAWRWLTKLELTKPPGPLIRWLLLLSLGLSCWAAGLPLDVQDWLGPIVIAGALILPDVAGFAIAGVRLDLKHATDELSALRQEVNAQARANSTSIAAIGDRAIEAVTRPMYRTAAQAVNAQKTGPAGPWPPAGRDAQEPQDSEPTQDVI